MNKSTRDRSTESSSETNGQAAPCDGQFEPDSERRFGGLGLGWRLAISTAVVVALVLGSISALQRHFESRREWADRSRLLTESLAPLSIAIEQAQDMDEAERVMRLFAAAFDRTDYDKRHFELRDRDGAVLLAAGDPCAEPPPHCLFAVVDVKTPLAEGGTGQLAVWQGSATLVKEMRIRWINWALAVGIAVVCVIATILVAQHFVIMRPIKHLIIGIERMEKGYKGNLVAAFGAREIRWIAYRFQNLIGELEEIMRRLLAANRRALKEASLPVPLTSANGALEDPPIQFSESALPTQRPSSGRLAFSAERKARMLEYLQNKCAMLEKTDPDDAIGRLYAKEAWEHEAGIAELLGEPGLRRSLEDAAFRILANEEYERLKSELEQIKQVEAGWVSERALALREQLELRDVQCVKVQHRIKSTAGVWRKMRSKGIELSQVSDVFAFRVIVFDEKQCYQALEAIHERFKPQLLRFKDYIAKPKPTGYRGIHTSVVDDDGRVFEVQIRTLTMHQEAESGQAAHWRYKAANPITFENASPSRKFIHTLKSRITLWRLRRRESKKRSGDRLEKRTGETNHGHRLN